MLPFAYALVPWGAAHLADRRSKQSPLFERPFLVVVLVGVVLVGLRLDSLHFNFPGLGSDELAWTAFYGLSPGSVSFVDYVFIALLGVLPSYYSAVAFEEEVRRTSTTLMRHGSLRNWWVGFVREHSMRTALYWGVLLAVTFLLASLAGPGANPDALPTPGLGQSVLWIAVLGWLQSLC